MTKPEGEHFQTNRYFLSGRSGLVLFLKSGPFEHITHRNNGNYIRSFAGPFYSRERCYANVMHLLDWIRLIAVPSLFGHKSIGFG